MNLRKELECPVCMEIPEKDLYIHQCYGGHLLCGECWQTLHLQAADPNINVWQATCPICRDPLPESNRARMAELLRDHLLEQGGPESLLPPPAADNDSGAAAAAENNPVRARRKSRRTPVPEGAEVISLDDEVPASKRTKCSGCGAITADECICYVYMDSEDDD